MDNSLFAYIERLEVLGFFSGYPLLYAIVLIIPGPKDQRNAFKSRLTRVLPYAYALTGTLYLGMILRNAYPHYSLYNLITGLEQPWLRIWGLLSILFWIPFFARKPIFSLVHSLVFFYFIIIDLWSYVSRSALDNQFIKNDMKVYGDSILLNLAAIVLIFTFSTLYAGIQHRSAPKAKL